MFMHEFRNDYRWGLVWIVTVEQHWKTAKVRAPNTNVYKFKAISENDLSDYCLTFTDCKNESGNVCPRQLVFWILIYICKAFQWGKLLLIQDTIWP